MMLIFVCLTDDLIPGFSYSNFIRETDGLELPLTITLILQANRVTKCVVTCSLYKFSLLFGDLNFHSQNQTYSAHFYVNACSFRKNKLTGTF